MSQLFTWKPEYSVGSPAIDAQHQRLFHMAAELHDAMVAGQGKSHMAELLKALVAYTAEHFATEERIMRQTGFPGYPEHHLEHEKLTHQVLEFQRQFEEGRAVLTIDLMQFLNDWLSSHIKASDKKMAAYVSAKH